jgi:transposase-like protein
VAKQRVGRYPKAFRKMAVERLKSCENIVALSEELGVHRRLLYKWRDQLEPIDDGEGPPANSRERELRQQVSHLKRLVADKTLEADFFKGVPHGPFRPTNRDENAIDQLCSMGTGADGQGRLGTG